MNNKNLEKNGNLKMAESASANKATLDAKSKFESQGEMTIKPGLMVHAKGSSEMRGSVGKQIGVVDHLDHEKYIKLNKDGSPDGRDRWIPTDWVEKVDGKAIYLNKTEQEFRADAFNYFPGEAIKKAV